MGLTEISHSLNSLSANELAELEHLVRMVRTRKGDCILYDDAYGEWSEDDQLATASFLAEAEGNGSRTR